MKKFVSILVALVMVLAATSALALSNISEISGLPDIPELPSMKVKSSGDVVTVTMSAPVAWMAAVRNWGDYTGLEFDENNVAVYSKSGDKVDPGSAIWGWAKGGYVLEEGEEHWAGWTGLGEKKYIIPLGEGEDAKDYLNSWKLKYKDGSYGVHNSGVETGTVHGPTEEYPYGYIEVAVKDMIVSGGSYAMPYAYNGATTDGINLYYDTHGNLVKAVMEVTGQNFFGSETAPVKSILTFQLGTYGKKYDKAGNLISNGKYFYYISNITEQIDENTSISADFASNGKCLRAK